MSPSADITFDEATHTYRVGDRLVPSVTQILKVIENFDFVPPDVLEAARRFGQHVHLATDLYDRGELNEASLSADVLARLGGYKMFLKDTGFIVTASERIVYNAQLGYAGTLDRIGMLGRSSALIDLKSGAVPRSVGPQTAAYREAEHAPPRRRFCLQLLRNNYRLTEQKNPADFSIFVSCLNVHRFLNKGVNTRVPEPA